MDHHDQPDIARTAAILVVTAAWATSGIFVKYILIGSELTPISLAFWRDLFSFIAFFVVLLVFNPKLLVIRKKDIKWVLGLGSLGLGSLHILWNYGVSLNGVAVSTIQQAVMPIITTIAASFFWAEKVTLRKAVAIVLALSGTVLISGILRSGAGTVTVSGFLVGIFIPIAYACFNLFNKQIAGSYHPFTILLYGFGFGTLTIFPFQLIQSFSEPIAGPAIYGNTWLLLSGLVLVSTVFPFTLYTFVLKRLQVSIATILCMAEIPLASLYAYILLKERLTYIQWIGAVLVIGGVTLLVLKQKQNTVFNR